jgi:hypothetical protein
MKKALGLTFTVVVLAAPNASAAEQSVTLTINRTDAGLHLNWPGSVWQADGSTVRPYFEVQRSLDLQSWQPVGERARAKAGPEQTLGATIEPELARAFFRLLSVPPGTEVKLGLGGEEVLGYSEAFAQQLERVGQITPEQFADRYSNSTTYLPGLAWDPTTAQFWEKFSANVDEVNQGKEWGQPGYRWYDTRLATNELAVFQKNGFVVSERLGTRNFGDMFYRLWHDDLPVFISTDAILQAWHQTYDATLEEIEETYLFNSLELVLNGMGGQVASAAAEVGAGGLRDSVLDADYFLTVARSLLAGSGTQVVSPLGQDARVAQTLADIQAEQLKEIGDFMGFCRIVDFSQFKVRGHYTHSERLARYFQCLMWLGRTDIPVAGGPWKRCPDHERIASPRELGVAVVLWHLLNASGQFETWHNVEQIIQTFVGPTDSLTFGQLGGLLAGAGIRTLADVPDLTTLEALQADILRGELGVQNIRSDWFFQPLGGAARYALPRTFTVFGQKFVPDSWALSQLVFSSILWVENGVTNKVPRRVPGALDIAFSVLRNDQVVPELVAQMTGTFEDPDRPHARLFRDGLPYQHNLAAVRGVMDQQTPETWNDNIYMNWLACLRELSSPTTDAEYPEAMRTRAWAMKTLNTQLASWTQLRHDTILYAKPSYADYAPCVYPKGFVEPRLEFWNRMKQMAGRTAERILELPYVGSYPMVTNRPPVYDPITGQELDPGGLGTNQISLVQIQSRQVDHLRSFSNIVAHLESLSLKELSRESFNLEDERFIDGLMEDRQGWGCVGPVAYTGWYPSLFYRTIYWDGLTFAGDHGAGAIDPLVVDVHTDVPSEGPPDPGGVLHEAIGWVTFLMLAVDNGDDRFICAGPVLSHFEFEVIGAPRRISDAEWGGDGFWGPPGILEGEMPPGVSTNSIEGLKPPVWTRSYLVPTD